MLTQPQIDKLKTHPQMGWITRLHPCGDSRFAGRGSFTTLVVRREESGGGAIAGISRRAVDGLLQPFAGRKAETQARGVIRGDGESAEPESGKKWSDASTKPLTATEIALKVGKVLGHYKMGKHFAHQIEEGKLNWSRRVETIEQEAKLDGVYVIRTSESAEQLSAADTVRGYKSLAQVERAFRSLKGLDLLIRPIRHRTEERVPAHVFLCMLAYYLEWHLRRVWAPLLFEDEELPQRAATTRSGSARPQLGISASQETDPSDS